MGNVRVPNFQCEKVMEDQEKIVAARDPNKMERNIGTHHYTRLDFGLFPAA